ncbi:hypothetical protein SAMN05216299_10462 [Nitrosospira sp. Nsp14]|nr:hypothetical protein SAMN05216299_10462 [Nitrosospira sp. Nsp14]
MIHGLFFIDQETKNSKQRAKQRRKTLKSQIVPPLISVFRIKSAKQFIILSLFLIVLAGFVLLFAGINRTTSGGSWNLTNIPIFHSKR